MGKFIKVLSNDLIKIEEYKNPRVCFNRTEYDDIENYCVLRETINPFQMFKENQQLKERVEYLERSNNRREETILNNRQEIADLNSVLDEIREYINSNMPDYDGFMLLEILDKVKE